MSALTNEYVLSALAKLGIPSDEYQNHPKFQALPGAMSAPLWDRLENPPYLLNVFELGALQNVRCLSQSGATGVGGSTVAQARQGRWDKLNTVLDINEKAKPKDERYRNPYVAWDQVKQFFNVVLGIFPTSAGGGLPQALFNALHEYLSLATICFGSITEDHQPKRVHFIAPIVIMVCSYFNGDVQVLAEEDIEGFHFDFVLKRGDKRLCIVEAKKDDILQGKTECLIACESLCNAEGLPVAYGIATNYLEWCFLKSEAHQVTEEMVSVWFQNNRMTIESLRNVASKIIAILE